MESIRSVLIRTSMATIQKEVSQLEHWLHHLSDDSNSSKLNIPSLNPNINQSNDLSSIYTALNKISDQMSAQQCTLNHLIDRIDILEGTREIHIDEHLDYIDEQEQEQEQEQTNEIWCDNTVLDNIIFEHTYTVKKEEPIVEEPVAEVPIVEESVVVIPPIVVVPIEEESIEEESIEEESIEEVPVEEVPVVEESVVEVPIVVVPVVEESIEVVPVVEESIVEESIEEVPVVEESIEEVPVVEVPIMVVPIVEVPVVVVPVVEESIEEVEEEGIELEEIEFKGHTYYKDSEGFIYTILEDAQPADTAIGYWREKSQSIIFYKTK